MSRCCCCCPQRSSEARAPLVEGEHGASLQPQQESMHDGWDPARETGAPSADLGIQVALVSSPRSAAIAREEYPSFTASYVVVTTPKSAAGEGAELSELERSAASASSRSQVPARVESYPAILGSFDLVSTPTSASGNGGEEPELQRRLRLARENADRTDEEKALDNKEGQARTSFADSSQKDAEEEESELQKRLRLAKERADRQEEAPTEEKEEDSPSSRDGHRNSLGRPSLRKLPSVQHWNTATHKHKDGAAKSDPALSEVLEKQRRRSSAGADEESAVKAPNPDRSTASFPGTSDDSELARRLSLRRSSEEQAASTFT